MTGHTKNELMRKVLSFIANNPRVCSTEIAYRLKVDYNTVATSLYYYRVQALLRRDKERVAGRVRSVYSLTDKGRRRLEWLVAGHI
ncbi:MAG: hypothetical protein PHI12_13590 [Dehalococcoidales bacterium]|nr:hypothetical protein [Dehalococcoidales bacterium]